MACFIQSWAVHFNESFPSVCVYILIVNWYISQFMSCSFIVFSHLNMYILVLLRCFVLCNKECPPETHLKLKSHEISIAHNICGIDQIVLKLTLPSSMTNFKTVGQLENKLWANEISQDLGLRGVSADIPQISCFQDFFYGTSIRWRWMSNLNHWPLSPML